MTASIALAYTCFNESCTCLMLLRMAPASTTHGPGHGHPLAPSGPKQWYVAAFFSIQRASGTDVSGTGVSASDVSGTDVLLKGLAEFEIVSRISIPTVLCL